MHTAEDLLHITTQPNFRGVYAPPEVLSIDAACAVIQLLARGCTCCSAILKFKDNNLATNYFRGLGYQVLMVDQDLYISWSIKS